MSDREKFSGDMSRNEVEIDLSKFMEMVTENNDSDAICLFTTARNPVEGVVKGIDGTNTSKSHVNNVTISWSLVYSITTVTIGPSYLYTS